MSEQSKTFSLKNMETYLDVAGSLTPIVGAYRDEKVRIFNNWTTEIGDSKASLSVKYNKLLSNSTDSYKGKIKQLLAEKSVSTSLVKLVQNYDLITKGEKTLFVMKATMAAMVPWCGLLLLGSFKYGAEAAIAGLVITSPIVSAAAYMYIRSPDRKSVKDGKAEIKRMIGKEDLHKTMLALGELHAKLPASLYEIKLDE